MKTTNIVELREDLLSIYDNLREGKLGTDEVKQAANVAGKIISTAKSQMEYNKMIQSKSRIPFMETKDENKPKDKN